MPLTRSHRPPHEYRGSVLDMNHSWLQSPEFDVVRAAVALVGVSIAAIGVGWLIARGQITLVIGAVAIVAFGAFASRAPAQLAAVLVLMVLNGVPGLNLGHRLPGGLKVQDAAVFGLCVLLLMHQDRSRNADHSRIVRAVRIWSGCLVAWWSYEVARSALLDGIPWLKAALYGREFLYFPILLLLALGARFPRRSLRAAGLLLLTGTTLNAVGQGIESLTGSSVSFLAHPALIDDTSGVTRLYSEMAYAINTALVFAVALFVSNEARGIRWVVGALAGLCFIDAATQLTRANYFALAVALVVALLFYVARQGSITGVLTRAMILAVAVAVLAVTLTSIGVSRTITPALHTVEARATSGFSALANSTGTVAYRENVDRQLLNVLGSKWPIGLGFLHPAARYVSGVPGGTIRNADTGVFNALMTMGIVGVLLVYAPLAYALRELLRAGRRTMAGSLSTPNWVLYGGAAWIAWAIAGSPTLVLLFSRPGLVVTTSTLAALSYVTSMPPEQRPLRQLTDGL
jgi:hypothetical protein